MSIIKLTDQQAKIFHSSLSKQDSTKEAQTTKKTKNNNKNETLFFHANHLILSKD